MNFSEIANARQSCRNYDISRDIADEQLENIINSAILSPSACNSQPYHITICKGNYARQISEITKGPWINKFTADVPVFFVISEMPYNATAGAGSAVKRNDYRSIDIGILSAYITAEATAQGIGTCIIGWFDNAKAKKICNLKDDVRLIIALGYPKENDKLRNKKRKSADELITILEE